MQLFPCPFCGERDEREFFFAGESGKVRPASEKTVSDAEWAKYMHEKRNEKGRVKEVWMHLTCSEVFSLERDSASMDVVASNVLRREKA